MQIKDEQSGESCSNADHKLAELPKVWVWTKLAEIGEINPKLMDEYSREDIEVTFLPMKCVQELTGKLDLSYTRKLSQVRKGYTPFIDGDLLFAKITPCMENGKVAIAHSLKNGIGFGSTEFHVIRLPESFPRKFFFYYLIREDLRRDAQRNMTGSAGQLRVPANYMQQIPIPLPPLHEQHRIVARIEELFTRLDAGVEALKKIKTQLKRYRQSVLKHAFEGKLTAEWREAHKHELEPASILLERIKQARNKTLKGKYKELPPLDTSTLPELPESWVWTELGQISTVASGGTPATTDDTNFGGDILWVTPADLSVNQGKFISKGRRNITQHGLSSSSAVLLPSGTVIFSSRAPIGYVAIAADDICTNQGCKNFIVHDGAFNEYVYYYLKANKSLAEAYASGTTFLELSASRANNLPIPLPPLHEQHKIVEEIERRFSVADEIEKTVDHSLKQAERLRQSTLKRAFEGRLVPQDLNDEPAEKLLERIREQRANQIAEKRVAVSKVKQKQSTDGN